MDNNSTNKLPNELSVDDLLTSLEKKKEDLETVNPENFPNDVVAFLMHFNIKPGENPVNKRVLHALYKTWSQNPLPARRFNRYASKYLPAFPGRDAFYKLNTDAMKVSEKTFLKLEERTKKKTKAKSYKTHFDNFLDFYNLKSGTRTSGVWLESFVLYYLYDKWTYKNRNINPLGVLQFKSFLELVFTHKRRTSNSTEWYRVNKDIEKYLPPQHLEDLRQGRIFRHGKKDKIAKKQSKESSPKTSV